MKDVDTMKESKANDKVSKASSVYAEETVKSAPTTSAMVLSWRRRRLMIIAGAIIVILIAGAGGAALDSTLNQRPVANNQISQHQTVVNDGNKVVTSEEENISNVVSKVSPSVVSITTQSQTNSSVYGAQEEDGAGTGIIVGKNGYILTNKHVVDGASTVGVVLADGTSYTNVQVLGTDPLNDVAFLKIPNVSNLPAAELGDSSSVQVGEEVVAIGNSLGQYQNTVTSGIISGTGRPISAQDGNSVENLTDLLQTDAAINPGNSGGPLLNLQGQVIGLNTAIVQDAQGIGFSIPINATKGSLKGVLAGGSVQRAYLGVNYIPITADVAQHYSLPVKAGAYVYSGTDQSAIVSGGPADKAGIKDKDIITQVGGVNVGDKGGVSSLVGEYAPGDTIQLTILRGSQTLTVNVTLQAYKSS
jgi:serine protease Do